ncbi:MAG: transcription termination factor Rho [Gemmatimonadales bacterium]
MSDQELHGVLELTGKGIGFIRLRQHGYQPSRDDIHVGQKVIQQYGLRSGDEIVGVAGRPPGRNKSATLRQVTKLNGQDPQALDGRPEFHRLGATHPKDRLLLECDQVRFGQPDYTNRIIDLLCPFGKGQRAMIVAPAKAGKTMVLQSVAEGITRNHPEATLYILLVDERPEEVTEMEMCGFGEVIASSFDYPPDRHISAAELTMERARRRVEMGQDVVIILDSITRLARAYNTVERGSGKTLTGGLDANSMEEPKRFLGSARRIDETKGGGSLTIISTALIDTGSKMDTVIFEEFKGTGNSELTLSRELADRRIFPAIDINQSATRKEELLLTPDELKTSHMLRNMLGRMDSIAAMQELLAMMKRTKSNAELVTPGMKA